MIAVYAVRLDRWTADRARADLTLTHALAVLGARILPRANHKLDGRGRCTACDREATGDCNLQVAIDGVTTTPDMPDTTEWPTAPSVRDIIYRWIVEDGLRWEHDGKHRDHDPGDEDRTERRRWYPDHLPRPRLQ